MTIRYASGAVYDGQVNGDGERDGVGTYTDNAGHTWEECHFVDGTDVLAQRKAKYPRAHLRSK